MKKIINWTFGSVFRTFGRILAYIGVGMLFALILSKKDIKITDLLGIQRVNAATTITPSTYQHKVLGKKYNDGILESQIDSGWFTGDYTGFCSETNRYCYLDTDYYVVTLPSSLDAGRTYTWVYNTWITDRPSQAKLNKIQYYITASNTGGYSGSSPANISSFSCRAGIEEGSTQKITFTCSITPATAVNYLYLRMDFSNLSDTINPGWRPFTSYGCNRGYLTYDNATTDAINQQTNIIQNEFTEITNQINENNQLVIDSLTNLEDTLTENQKVCNEVQYIFDKNRFETMNEQNGYLRNNGTINQNDNWKISQFIILNANETYSLKGSSTWNVPAYCIYDSSENLENCYSYSNGNNDITLSYTTDKKIRISYSKEANFSLTLKGTICKNGNQALNDTLTDDNVSDAENEAGSFFENFTTNTHGLTSIITAPLTAIESLTSKTCSPLVLPLPFVDEDLTLPCMRPIYEENFGGFMTLYDAITLGIVSYWILVRIFALVKDFKNPDHDEIEVVDL